MHGLVNKFRIIIGPSFSVTPSHRLGYRRSLIHTLHRHIIRDVLNKVTWNANTSATLTVCSQYQIPLSSQPQDVASKALWKVVSRLKVKITMWLTVRDRLHTWFYLYRCHMRPMSSCIFYGNHHESSNHIFLSCDFARTVWDPIVDYLALPSWLTSLRTLWEDL